MGKGRGVEGMVMAEQGNTLGQSLPQRGIVVYRIVGFQHHAVGMQVSEEIAEEVARFL